MIFIYYFNHSFFIVDINRMAITRDAARLLAEALRGFTQEQIKTLLKGTYRHHGSSHHPANVQRAMNAIKLAKEFKIRRNALNATRRANNTHANMSSTRKKTTSPRLRG